MYILQLLFIKEQNTEKTLLSIDSLCPGHFLISEKTIIYLLSLLKQVRIKLIHFYQQYPDRNKASPELNLNTLKETVQFLINYSKNDNQNIYSGAYNLSVLYYERNGSFHENAQFLFGTPTQFLF